MSLGKADKPSARKRSDIEWKKQSAKLRDQLGLSSEHKGWTESHTLHGLPKTARVADFVDIAWAHRRHNMGANTLARDAAKGFWCDPSQAVERKAWGGSPGCLCATSMSYSYERDLTLSGYDHCKLQGFPGGQCPRKQHEANGSHGTPGFSDEELRDIAGNSFFLPCITTAVYAYWLNPYAPWWKSQRNTSGEATRGSSSSTT